MTFENSSQIQSFDWQKLLFLFEGRTRRSHFWIGWLLLLGVGVITGWLPVIGGLISLLLIWPNLAITVKRLHDMGYTGWLAAIPWVANIVGFTAGFIMIGVTAIASGAALEHDNPFAIMALLGPAFGLFILLVLVNLGFLIWIGVMPGQFGENRFGADPKAL